MARQTSSWMQEHSRNLSASLAFTQVPETILPRAGKRRRPMQLRAEVDCKKCRKSSAGKAAKKNSSQEIINIQSSIHKKPDNIDCHLNLRGTKDSNGASQSEFSN